MKAKYKIQTRRIDEFHFESLEFEAEALSYKKCIQILRLKEGGKLWKGYSFRNMHYNGNGLTYLDLVYVNPTINNNSYLCIEQKT